MKIVAKPINVIAVFNCDNIPVPRKFRYEADNGETVEIPVDRINSTEKRRLAGIESIIYSCQSMIDGSIRLYELKYIIKTYSWELYKF